MFGREYEIVRVFPRYFLDYREERTDPGAQWTDRITSSSGDWSGNVFDFYFRVLNLLQRDIKVPFEIKNGEPAEEAPVHIALREALANCMVNADYHGRGGVVIIKNENGIRMSNPGTFRVKVDAAKSGGVSDPRNSLIRKMMKMIGIGEGAGSGIHNIFKAWKEQNLREPEILQSMDPDRTTIFLPFLSLDDAVSATKIGDKEGSAIKMIKRQMIIDYLTDHAEANTRELSGYLDLQPSRTRDYLRELINDGIVIPSGEKRNRVYKLKA